MQQSCWSTSFAHALRRACLRIPHLWFASLGESARHFPVEDPLSCHHCWRKGANSITKPMVYWGGPLILGGWINTGSCHCVSHPRYWRHLGTKASVLQQSINSTRPICGGRGSQAMRDSKQQTTSQKCCVNQLSKMDVQPTKIGV